LRGGYSFWCFAGELDRCLKAFLNCPVVELATRMKKASPMDWLLVFSV